VQGVKAPPRLSDLRAIFSGQARLLAVRAERGLPIDERSLLNLLGIYVLIVRGKAQA
jgi:hypothetical protein